jgi:hypothetical protein
MSQLASFRLLPIEDLPLLVSGTAPAAGEELSPLPYGAETLLDLELMAGFLTGSHQAEAKRLSDANGNSVVLFDRPAAHRILALKTPGRKEIVAFLKEQYGESHPATIDAMVGAAEHLKGWLSAVVDGQIGILSIG